MKKPHLSLLAALLLFSSTHAADIGALIHAQVILGQTSQIAEKYQDVQDLLSAGTITLEVPDPVEGNTGKFYFPYDQNGYLTPWADKAINTQKNCNDKVKRRRQKLLKHGISGAFAFLPHLI